MPELLERNPDPLNHPVPDAGWDPYLESAVKAIRLRVKFRNTQQYMTPSRIHPQLNSKRIRQEHMCSGHDKDSESESTRPPASSPKTLHRVDQHNGFIFHPVDEDLQGNSRSRVVSERILEGGRREGRERGWGWSVQEWWDLDAERRRTGMLYM
ncbi:hypothetical protein B0H13DRAFT_1898372 [Mycena leptocephala]|nr:hypothetical protein B0H13DRAFT_1898372 [Mycena leptocephala]